MLHADNIRHISVVGMLDAPVVTLPCVVDDSAGDVEVNTEHHYENLISDGEDDSDVELLRWPRSAQRSTAQAELDSGDEWLQELLQAGRSDDFARFIQCHSSGEAALVARPQQHESLQTDYDGLARPIGSSNSGFSALAACPQQSRHFGFAASVDCPQAACPQRHSTSSRNRTRSPLPKLSEARRRGAVRCIGDPCEMIESNARKMHWLSTHAEFNVASVRVLIRPEVTPCSPSGLKTLAQSLLAAVEGILTRTGICIFKIGLTHDPFWRMYNKGYGYAVRGELYSRMHVLLASFPEICGHIEEALIAAKRDQPGCRNMNPGQESMPTSGLCYVYVVTEPCGDGKGLRVR